MDFLTAHWLDIVTTVLGLAYILLEYKASIWMWVVGFVMQALGISYRIGVDEHGTSNKCTLLFSPASRTP